MRKIKPPPSGSGAKKKAYYLADAMQFCLPFVKTSAPPSTGNLPHVPPENDEPSEETIAGTEILQDTTNQDDAPTIESPHSPSLLQESSRPSPDGPDVTLQPHHSSHPPPQPSCNQGTKRKTLKNKSAVEADQCFADYFKAKKAKLESTSTTSNVVNKKEALKMFLLSLLPELEELTDSQIKIFKRKVFNLIDEISAPPSVVTQVSSHSSIASDLSYTARATPTFEPTRAASNYFSQFTQDVNTDDYYVQEIS